MLVEVLVLLQGNASASCVMIAALPWLSVGRWVRSERVWDFVLPKGIQRMAARRVQPHWKLKLAQVGLRATH